MHITVLSVYNYLSAF